MSGIELDAVTISSTVVVISKDHKALIVQRMPNENFPNKWTVAGGKIQRGDGILAGNNLIYFTTEAAAARELEEETGIRVPFPLLKYFCSICAGQKLVVLSYYVILDRNADEIEIKLNDCQDYRWITFDQIEKYDFILDIGKEIKEILRRIMEDEK